MIRVLLAEDHNLVRSALRRVLEEADGVSVVGEAGNGHDAVKTARDLKPEVVVMDFAMPGLMGAAATQQILEFAPTTGVLIVSMHSEPSYVRASLDAGARGYLLKSAQDIDLIESIRRVAAGHYLLDSRITLPDILSGIRPPTPRELEVLGLIGEGKSNKEIAAILGISPGTVAVHRANVTQALALGKTAKLTLYAIGRGLIDIN